MLLVFVELSLLTVMTAGSPHGVDMRKSASGRYDWSFLDRTRLVVLCLADLC